MLLLVDLEPELISLILEFVDDTSPQSTQAVACVNKYLNEITTLIAHRHQTIHIHGFVDDDLKQKIRSWTEDETALANIRTLTVKGWFGRGYYDEEDEPTDVDEEEYDNDEVTEPDEQLSQIPVDPQTWQLLIGLFIKMGRLRQFNWNVAYALPSEVYDALVTYQKASTLHIREFTRALANTKGPEPIELRLATSTALTHIRCVKNQAEQWPDYTELAFRRIISSAPNLQYAGFINRAAFGSTQPDEIAEAKPDFSIDKTSTSVRQLTLDGVEMSKNTLDDWSATIDLTKLESIKCSRGVPTLDYFQHAADALPNLKKISLNLRAIEGMRPSDERNTLWTTIRTYISTCSPLRLLSLWSWMEILELDDILQQHGPTLQSLQLREREHTYDSDRAILTLDNIKSIRHNCPRLKSLTFDLNRHEGKLRLEKDIYGKYYEELAQIEHLETLQIYLDLGVARSFDAAAYPTDSTNDPIYIDEPDTDEDDDRPANNLTTDTASFPNTTGTMPAPEPATDSDTIFDITPAASSMFPARMKKKPRIPKRTAVSHDAALQTYIQHMWTSVFGKKAGPRRLDVKVGEWESQFTSLPNYRVKGFLRYFVVRPHERDDVDGPVFKMHKAN